MNQLNLSKHGLRLPEGISFEDEVERLKEISERVSHTSDFWLFSVEPMMPEGVDVGCPPCYCATGPGTETAQAAKDAEFATHAKADILHLLELVARRSTDVAVLAHRLQETWNRLQAQAEKSNAPKIIVP